jgi:hypothetical protein
MVETWKASRHRKLWNDRYSNPRRTCEVITHYTSACTLRKNALFFSLENRLCLGVLIGRQRFRTLKIFGNHSNLPVHPARATGPAILQVWRRTPRVTQNKRQNLEAGQASKGGRHSSQNGNSAQVDFCAHGASCARGRVSVFLNGVLPPSTSGLRRPPPQNVGRVRSRLKEKAFFRLLKKSSGSTAPGQTASRAASPNRSAIGSKPRRSPQPRLSTSFGADRPPTARRPPERPRTAVA